MVGFDAGLQRAQGSLEAGLGEVTFSLHGHTAELHDRLTAVPGAFRKLMKGMMRAIRDNRIIVKAFAKTAGRIDLFAEGPGEEWTLALPELIENKAGELTFAIPLKGAQLGSNDAPPKVRLTLVGEDGAVETEIALD